MHSKMTGGTVEGLSDPEPAFGPPSRRTYFAEERTLLAWWRTGISASAVALAVGGLLPHLAKLPAGRFVALGAGYGLLAIFFVIGGTLRARVSHHALERNSYESPSGTIVIIVTVYITVLVILTVIAFL
jgi:putative membrane protein